MARARADVVLTSRGMFASREQARAAILAGEVRSGGERVVKPGQLIEEDADLEVAEAPRYVSRGGVKLAAALEAFGVEAAGKHVIDVGASTGGFTDCVLQRGAAAVAAVDVGYGQFAWSLRNDPRVRVFERTNIRDADPDAIGAPFDLAVVDVSFIGLGKVLPAVAALLSAEGEALALVKPQFEAGKGRVGKKGVVREAAVHLEVLERVLSDAREQGFEVRGLTFSPITGPEGNIEFWVRLGRGGRPAAVDVARVVEAAHAALGGR
ncbi:MAG: TlyA family RNA methyltransferase [Coriobacteriia bacterium]|nr:TlyA family RNA methyltransferase [Coriobacteriia bacterium]